LTIDGEDHIGHGRSDDAEHKLETLNLLEEEHVEWHGLTSVIQALWSLEVLELIVDFNLDEVWWKKFDQFLLKLVLDLLFAGLTRATARVLWHGVDKHDNHLTRLLETVGQIGVTVKTENERVVLLWEGLDVLEVSGVLVEVWNVVVVLSDEVVEAVLLFEDFISNPEGTIGAEGLTI